MDLSLMFKAKIGEMFSGLYDIFMFAVLVREIAFGVSAFV